MATDKLPHRTQEEILEILLPWLKDGFAWNWTHMISQRDAADAVLQAYNQLRLRKEAHVNSWIGRWMRDKGMAVEEYTFGPLP